MDSCHRGRPDEVGITQSVTLDEHREARVHAACPIPVEPLPSGAGWQGPYDLGLVWQCQTLVLTASPAHAERPPNGASLARWQFLSNLAVFRQRQTWVLTANPVSAQHASDAAGKVH